MFGRMLAIGIGAGLQYLITNPNGRTVAITWAKNALQQCAKLEQFVVAQFTDSDKGQDNAL